MEAITFKTLTEERDINEYLQRFEGYVRVKLPYDYTQRSRIVAAYKGGKMVAGYMLVTRPGFRSLMFVPDEVREQHAFFRNDQYEMMEVNGLWIGAGVRRASEQFRIWLHMLRDVFLCRKKYVLLMADTRNTNIGRIHALMGSKEIYQGPPMLMAGSKTHSSIRVGYTTRWTLIRHFPKYLLEYRHRAGKAGRRQSGGKTFAGDAVEAG
ncbi:MAG: hypothetical protein WEB57_09580 [Pseudohongiellaceae bacterium]